MNDITIAAFKRTGIEPRRTWMVSGLPVATYANQFGHLCGYVRLPSTHPDLLTAEHAELSNSPVTFTWPDGSESSVPTLGYDYIGVPAPGGWTYGPDFEGWIGFDTSHPFDRWPVAVRRELVPEKYREGLERLLELEARFPADCEDDVYWTETEVEHALTMAAQMLAHRARQAIRTRDDRS